MQWIYPGKSANVESQSSAFFAPLISVLKHYTFGKNLRKCERKHSSVNFCHFSWGWTRWSLGRGLTASPDYRNNIIY